MLWCAMLLPRALAHKMCCAQRPRIIMLTPQVWCGGILQKQQAVECSAAKGLEFALDAMRAVSAETTAVPLTLLFRQAHSQAPTVKESYFSACASALHAALQQVATWWQLAVLAWFKYPSH